MSKLFDIFTIGFSAKNISPLFLTKISIGIKTEISKNYITDLIYKNSLHISYKAMYSSSVELDSTISCFFFEDQETILWLIYITQPLNDFLFSFSPKKSYS